MKIHVIITGKLIQTYDDTTFITQSFIPETIVYENDIGDNIESEMLATIMDYPSHPVQLN
jgi:hypothetical protein